MSPGRHSDARARQGVGEAPLDARTAWTSRTAAKLPARPTDERLTSLCGPAARHPARAARQNSSGVDTAAVAIRPAKAWKTLLCTPSSPTRPGSMCMCMFLPL